MKIRTFLYIAAIAVLASCSSKSNKEKEESAVRVKTYYPTNTNSEEIFISGMVSAKQTAVISTKVMGYIDKIYVKQGDLVKKGQTLIVINSSDLKAKEAQSRAMITEADAAVKDAQRDYQRYQTLHEQKSVSDKELENVALKNISAKAHLQMAREGLKEVKSMLAYTNIKAPFTGVITQKIVDEGNIANPGMQLLSVEQSGDMNITASVPENYIAYIHAGDKVKIDIKSLGIYIHGFISEISPSATMTGGQYGMKISIGQKDKAKLRAGMYAGIHIPNKKADGGTPQILVEKSSIVTKDQLTGVYVADKDNRAILHWVRLGNETGDQVVVLSGLSETDRVIESANVKLYNGQKIIVTD
ncbi:MAG: efflux RND transporter periplasmic adaptor subunit [Prevotella sp.]|jgi:RND family efflux transporter MFP subunit|nr:efflux RND transporter periplasmic adaptor subunit [Prevotella sp.]MBP8686304.1 efflux RND transporter periplasmic adaptor subunit [Prevotella sp.]MBP9981926.1 efflux RND transporter periplasmic adaptor subunit [Prevotella sp.]MCI1731447.1 efflux RND transporter periplasmic adaptor subunit [Prevotella sp.]